MENENICDECGYTGKEEVCPKCGGEMIPSEEGEEEEEGEYEPGEKKEEAMDEEDVDF